MIARAAAVWVGLMVVAIANGALRESVLVPRLGAATAHVVSTLLLCLAILAIALGTIEWMLGGATRAGAAPDGGIDGPATGGRTGGGRAAGTLAGGATRNVAVIGALWLALVLAFEFGFGHLVGGKSWSELLHEYNVAAGRVWVAVPMVTALAPWMAARVKGLTRGH